MKYHLVIIGFNLSVLFASGQAPSLEWQRCYGGSDADVSYSIQQTLDHGFIIGGITTSNDGDVSGYHGGQCGITPNQFPCNDALIIKIDSIGGIIWQKTIGGSGNDLIYSIQLSQDSGYIMSGWTSSTDGDLLGVNNIGGIGGHFWIVKLDSTGAIIWQRCYGGSIAEGAYSIIQTRENEYIVVGETQSNDLDVQGLHSSGHWDIWVIKLDSMGNLKWQKCLGGTNDDVGNVVRQTFNGNYIIAGNTESMDGDVISPIPVWSLQDYWFIELDTAGSIRYSRSYGGTKTERLRDLIQTPDSGFVLVGVSYSINYDINCSNQDTLGRWWLVKTDKNHFIQHQRCFGGTAYEEAYSIQCTPDSGYIVAGYTRSNNGDVTHNFGQDDCWIIKLDKNFNMEWQQCYGGLNDDGADARIVTTHEGGYAFTVQSLSNSNQVSGNHGGASDIWFVKLGQLPNTISEFSDQNKECKIHFNNTTNMLTLLFSSESSEKIILDLFDLTGRMLLKNELLTHEGLNEYSFTVNHLPDGVYIVRLRGKNYVTVHKLMTD